MDRTMADYILSIIKVNPNIPLSWGINSFKVLDNGLQFKVNGFKFKGIVQVLYDECWDTFKVKLLEDSKQMALVKEIEQLYIDNLTFAIDCEIEKTDNYKQDIENWLNSI